MGSFVEIPEGQRSYASPTDHCDDDPLKELSQDDSFEHLPIVIPECRILIPEDIEVLEVDQLPQREQAGVIHIITEDGT